MKYPQISEYIQAVKCDDAFCTLGALDPVWRDDEMPILFPEILRTAFILPNNGDLAQLPPVGMNTSPTLDADYLHREFGVQAKECELTQVMRQEDGLILRNAMNIRGMIGSFRMRHFELETDGHSVS